MNVVSIVAIVFGCSLLALGVIGGTILIAIRMIKGSASQSTQQQEKETQMIQEIFQGLQQMEERVDALETLLMEREQKEK